MSTAKTLEKINDALEEAIKPIINKGANMNAAELDVLTKAVCTLEKIQQIQEGGGSYDDYSRSRSYNGNSYDEEGNSYRRGRSAITGRYVSRDAMPDYEGSTSRRYYDGDRHSGYSGHSIKDRMIAQLEKMYDDAQTEHERNLVNNWIRRISNEV